MRFSILATLFSLSGFLATGLAAPAPDAAALTEQRRTTTPAGDMAAIVSAANSQISAVSAALQQNLTGVSPASSPQVLAGAQAAVTDAFTQLGNILNQAGHNVTGGGGAAASRKRQSSGGASGPDPSTGDLVNAISALVTEVTGLIGLALNALGLGSLAGQVTGALTILGGLINSIANVVVDVLPFLPDIASVIAAVGTLLSGIGSLIPKAP